MSTPISVAKHLFVAIPVTAVCVAIRLLQVIADSIPDAITKVLACFVGRWVHCAAALCLMRELFWQLAGDLANHGYATTPVALVVHGVDDWTQFSAEGLPTWFTAALKLAKTPIVRDRRCPSVCLCDSGLFSPCAGRSSRCIL